MKKAVEKGIINENPFDNYQIDRTPTKSYPVLERIEVKRLLQTSFPRCLQVKDAFFISYHHGIKIEWLKKLRRSDVVHSGKGASINLNHTATKVTKIRMNNITAPLLLKYCDIQKEIIFDKLKHNSRNHTMVRLWGAMAGIKNLTFSHARNTYIKEQLSNGAMIVTLKEKLGITNGSKIKSLKEAIG